MSSTKRPLRTVVFGIVGIGWGSLIVVFTLLSISGGFRARGLFLIGQWVALALGIAMAIAGVSSLVRKPQSIPTAGDRPEMVRTKSRKRRWIWAASLVALTFGVGGIAWVIFTTHQVDARRESLNGIMPMLSMYDAKGRGQPSWHRQLMGDDAPGYAEIADFTRVPQLTDEAMPRVAQLKQLKTLILSDRYISDAGLAALRGMPELNFLALNGTRVSDAGMAYLVDLPALTQLDLRRTQITDIGVRKVADLPQLHLLRLAETAVTDVGLAYIGKYVNLVELDLNGTAISDQGIRHLRSLQNLRTLKLQKAQLTDSGLASLSGMKHLQVVELRGTQITDAGLRHMYSWSALKRIELPEQISHGAMAELKKRFPAASMGVYRVEKFY